MSMIEKYDFIECFFEVFHLNKKTTVK